MFPLKRSWRNPNLASCELRRIKGEYMPYKAQKDYENKRRTCHKPHILGMHPQLYTFIAAKIAQAHWSPKQICGRLWCEFHFKLSPNPNIITDTFISAI